MDASLAGEASASAERSCHRHHGDPPVAYITVAERPHAVTVRNGAERLSPRHAESETATAN